MFRRLVIIVATVAATVGVFGGASTAFADVQSSCWAAGVYIVPVNHGDDVSSCNDPSNPTCQTAKVDLAEEAFVYTCT